MLIRILISLFIIANVGLAIMLFGVFLVVHDLRLLCLSAADAAFATFLALTGWWRK